MEDLIELIEGQPFPVALKNASQMRWSGLLRAVRDSEQVGVVVMRDGHVAWAVSSTQKENFGSFLERIGMIPKDKLDEVVAKYRSLGKTKKLGALLEESGLITHSTLRECLKAHVRAAISSMSDDPGIIIEARDGEMAIDAGLIFMLSEVSPSPDDDGEPADTPSKGTEAVEEVVVETAQEPETGILDDFASLPGYLYSFVSDISGKVLALHSTDGVNVSAERVAPAVLAWVSAGNLSSVDLDMGGPTFAFIQCETGSLFVHLTGPENRCFVAVACDEDSKLGVVRHKISEMMPAIRRFTEAG